MYYTTYLYNASVQAWATDQRAYRLAMAYWVYNVQWWWYSRPSLLRVGVHAHPLSLYPPPAPPAPHHPIPSKFSERELPVLSHIATLPFSLLELFSLAGHKISNNNTGLYRMVHQLKEPYFWTYIHHETVFPFCSASALQQKSPLCIPRKGIARPQFQFLHSCERFIYSPGLIHIFSCSRKGRPMMGIYKSLIDTWMWKLGLRPPNSLSGNIYFEFSVFCLCSVPC